jgi:hypothetical protein
MAANRRKIPIIAKNETERQKPRNAECGHNFPFLLVGLYLAVELRAQSANGQPAPVMRKPSATAPDRPSAKWLAQQPSRPLVRHLVAVPPAIGAKDHTDPDRCNRLVYWLCRCA